MRRIVLAAALLVWLLAVFYLGHEVHALVAGWTWDNRKLSWVFHP